MKNYYEILEVDKNASQEVIEKAYKALAKKYHPDLQTGSKQNEFAEKMKIINEAYEVLSNDYKRQQYNEKLQSEQKQGYSQNQGISQEEQERIIRENYALKQQLNRMGYKGYKIRYENDMKYYLKLAKYIGVTILILFLIYQIPPVKHFFQDMYNENVIFKAIVDIFKNTFSTGF